MTVPVRRRTRAREIALQFLYLLEMRGEEAMEEFEPFFDHHSKRGPDRRGAADIAEFGRGLVNGVRDNRETLNQWIERIARNWRLERMAHVDRNVLRLAVYELIYHPETPFKVVINEAIDIAKRFSTTMSGSFVNGILDRARMVVEKRREAGIGLEEPPSPEEVVGQGEIIAAPAPTVAADIPQPTPRARKPGPATEDA